MAYPYSDVDKHNLKWFPTDHSKATLISIKLVIGNLRGLFPFTIDFKYPISVIAGKNGSGKSTILALAACAFHNTKDGFRLPLRKYPYYTFSDFFIQASDEVQPDGIHIKYNILYDDWKKSSTHPDGIGIGVQSRIKNKGGKWNNYAHRVDRNVIFFGIERVVPHSEKSVSRSYRYAFKKTEHQGWEDNVKKVVSKILGSKYDEFWHKEYGKYHLPMVQARGTTYSGFNMGAGENALFEIFSTIFACAEGSLLVIDEIELGLHEEAQTRFMNELKKVCENRHVQIICTTHSMNILKCVPPEGRFYVERIGDETIVTPGISPLFAGGKLAGENSNELDIFVEDGCAKNIVQSVLDHEIRTRVNIIPIGSDTSIIRQLAARYKNLKLGECIGILDGDKSVSLGTKRDYFLKALENVKDEENALRWIGEHLITLPGSTRPEIWLLNQCNNPVIKKLAVLFEIHEERLQKIIEESKLAEKHSELYMLANELGHVGNTDFICQTISRQIDINHMGLFDDFRQRISALLEDE